MDLTNKTALITGSAKGLGMKTAWSLAKQGCHVIVNYVNSAEAAFRLVTKIKEQGGRAEAIQADISKQNERVHLMEQAETKCGGVDILINNAGPFVRERRVFADYDMTEIEHLIQGNLVGPMSLDYLALPHMRKQGWGRIIHLGFGHSSEARGWPHRSVYAAAKVGLVSFTKTLAMEEAENGITVNMVSPGDIRGENKEKNIAAVSGLKDEETPRGRPGSGEDVARVISFLCDPRSDFVTGTTIDVTGGMDAIRSLPL